MTSLLTFNQSTYEIKAFSPLYQSLLLPLAGFPRLALFILENRRFIDSGEISIFGLYSKKKKRFVAALAAMRDVVFLNSLHLLMWEVEPRSRDLELFSSILEAQGNTLPCVTATMKTGKKNKLPIPSSVKVYSMTVEDEQSDTILETTLLVKATSMYERLSPLVSRFVPTNFPRGASLQQKVAI